LSVDEGADQDRLDALPVSVEGPASIDDELMLTDRRPESPDLGSFGSVNVRRHR
jgi:hypothetical protein